MPISVPENKTQAAAIAGVSRIIKLPVAYEFSVILRVAQGGAAYSPVLKCTIIVKNSIPPRLTFFPSGMSSASIAPYCTSAKYARRAARAAASIAASVTFAMHRRVPHGCQLL